MLSTALLALPFLKFQQDSFQGLLSHPPSIPALENIRPEIAGLYQFNLPLVVVQEELPDPLKGALEVGELDGLTIEALNRNGIRTNRPIIHYSHFDDRVELARHDYRARHLSIDITAVKNSRDLCFTVHLEATRGVFVHPGHYQIAVVYQTESQRLLSLHAKPRKALLKSIQTVLDTFTKDYKEANANESKDDE